ncbi:MAG: 5-deoxy-glucuronate isomerase [Lentisphaeria bacterium]|nr:5-deoxy-glucuronate isomerase [Lentisphaeria bacterium]
MKHHIPGVAGAGYHRVLEVGDRGMAMTAFGLLRLGAGCSWSANSGGREVALVLLGGRCAVMAGSVDFGPVGARADVFSGDACTVFVPPGTPYRVTALSAVDVAVCESPSDARGEPALIRPEEAAATRMTIGKDNFTRTATILIGDRFPARHLFIGEAWVPSGNWASYPPHRHDVENPPDEIDMEEIYFFRFRPAGGFGMQRIYTEDGSVNAAYTVRENDTVAIPEGYHPVVTAPGYTMYYLWVMTGNSRGFISHKDSAHSAAVL